MRDGGRRRLDWPSWTPWVLTLAVLLYLVGLTVWLGVASMGFPYQLDYGEGVMLHSVKAWAHGQPIYKTIEGYPYLTFNYAPLPTLLALALTPLLGVTYAAGRLWTLLAIAGVAGLLLAWIRQATGRWPPAATAALLFVGAPYVYHWAPLFRVDLVGLALTLAGLYAVWRAVEGEPRVAGPGRLPALLWLAALLFVAALYAKQSFVFAPAAALVYLFFFVDRRQALTMAGIMVLLGGSLFLLANTLTGGGFWFSLVASNVNPFLWPEFWQQVGDFFGMYPVLALLAAWYVVDKALRRQRVGLQDLYLATALLSIGLAGKAGAWENYFFEALAALALCAGLGLARMDAYGRWAYRLLAPALIVVQVVLMWHTPRVAERYLRLTRTSNEEMAPILARTPDPIVSEDMGLLVTNDRVLDYHSFQYSQLARAGRWDQAWELEALRQGRFSLVILEEGTRHDVDRYQRFTRQFLSELDRNYRAARTVGKYVLYEPAPLQHERQVTFGEEMALVGWSLQLPGVDGPSGMAPLPPDWHLAPGDAVGLTVVWRAQRALEADYVAFAHMVDEVGVGWSGDDHAPSQGLYPTSSWGVGEMVRDTFELVVPPDAPPGLYHVQVGWYDPVTQARLGTEGSDTAQVAVVPVDWTAAADPDLAPLDLVFGDVIALQGFGVTVEGREVRVTLRWSAEAFMDTDHTVFVHLVPAEGDGQTLAQDDAPPMQGRWPTSLWLPGMALDDVHLLSVPPEVPAGTYALLVGFYEPGTGRRLRLEDGRDAVRLTEVEVPF